MSINTTEKTTDNKTDKNTLTNFIDHNQKLISILGVFTALTVFTVNLDFKVFGYALSFIFLALTLILWIEVLGKFPSGAAHWRLSIFETLLGFSFLGISFYWLLSYREIWHAVMFLPLMIIIATSLLNIINFYIKKYDLFNKIFRTKPGKLEFIRYLLFLILTMIVLLSSMWISSIIAPFINNFLDHAREDMLKWIPQN